MEKALGAIIEPIFRQAELSSDIPRCNTYGFIADDSVYVFR